MPLGISYYTLQSVSYVVDVYRGKIEPDRHFGRLALFVAFFPQIVEGRSGAMGQLAQQLYEPHRLSTANLMQGMQMILWGLFKKMVVADRAGYFCRCRGFMTVLAYTGLPVMLAVLLLYHSNLCRFFWRDGYCARSGTIIWHPDGAELPPPVFLNLRAGILAPLAYHAWRMAA